ncbi:hypothetical protein [Fictibacillus sp. KU28468]|uniref:hypothetical protein n=1 Tax=Fictibacillus sp. KU28468 TaxID=2991053 RepID=UPI00223CF83F|nr:hypothetical protein [Fictibacillus sp. KU28468]UZJ77760.1 hypothetical protein OKX00_16540 [Fictibacillus sp. KU28468]
MKAKMFCIILGILLLTGCSLFATGKENLTWYDTSYGAIHKGAKEEGITQEDIMGRTEIAGDVFIFYEKKVSDGDAIGVVNIGKKNGKYTWYRSSPEIQIKNQKNNSSPSVHFKVDSLSKHKYTVYLGRAKSNLHGIDTVHGNRVAPTIDKKRQIYYFMEPIR